MEKIPFTVSSRAAILIGRENISNTKGAIIELVKNTYDADSEFCLIYIDNKYSRIPKILEENELLNLVNRGIKKLYFQKLYVKKDNIYILKDNSSIFLNAYAKRLKKLSSIYIIDAGEGMTSDIIKNYWMNIGTNNKLGNYLTNDRRVKAGAKGIGRFALDKLGAKCTMITIRDPSYKKIKNISSLDIPKMYNSLKPLELGSFWKVNWKDFEAPNTTINEVSADLDSIYQGNLSSNTQKFLPELSLDLIKNILNNPNHG